MQDGQPTLGAARFVSRGDTKQHDWDTVCRLAVARFRYPTQCDRRVDYEGFFVSADLNGTVRAEHGTGWELSYLAPRSPSGKVYQFSPNPAAVPRLFPDRRCAFRPTSAGRTQSPNPPHTGAGPDRLSLYWPYSG